MIKIATGTLTLIGTEAGLPEGAVNLGPLSLTTAAPVGEVLEPTLALGDNTIPIPPGATAVLVILPTGNLVAVKLKGAAGDAGIALNKAAWFVFAPDPAQASFVLNAAAAISLPTQIVFM